MRSRGHVPALSLVDRELPRDNVALPHTVIQIGNLDGADRILIQDKIACNIDGNLRLPYKQSGT